MTQHTPTIIKNGLDKFAAARRDVWDGFDALECAIRAGNQDGLRLAREQFAEASTAMRLTLLELERDFGIGGGKNA